MSPRKLLLRRLGALAALSLAVAIGQAALAPDAGAHAGHTPPTAAVDAAGQDSSGPAAGDEFAPPAPAGENHDDCCHKGGVGISCTSLQLDVSNATETCFLRFSRLSQWTDNVGPLSGLTHTPPIPPPISEIE